LQCGPWAAGFSGLLDSGELTAGLGQGRTRGGARGALGPIWGIGLSGEAAGGGRRRRTAVAAAGAVAPARGGGPAVHWGVE
jgi:hypothetical protein